MIACRCVVFNEVDADSGRCGFRSVRGREPVNPTGVKSGSNGVNCSIFVYYGAAEAVSNGARNVMDGKRNWLCVTLNYSAVFA